MITEDVTLMHVEFLSVELKRRVLLTHRAQMEVQYMENILPDSSHLSSLSFA
jgi:hypothetical protein